MVITIVIGELVLLYIECHIWISGFQLMAYLMHPCTHLMSLKTLRMKNYNRHHFYTHVNLRAAYVRV